MVEAKNNILESDLEAMALNGVHLGSLRSHSNPKMKSFVWSNKNAFQIIDLEKSKKNLEAAIEFLSGIKKKGGVILFVGTGMPAKDIIKKTAEDLNMPYVSEHWFGGTLTNFSTIIKQANRLKDLEKQKASGELEKYTKYEALKLQEKMKKLRRDFGGIVNMTRMPDAVWISSAVYDKIAVAEAVKKGVPLAGLVNTNSDPTLFTYPIPANDSAFSAVNFIVGLMRDALMKVEVPAPAAEAAVEKKKISK